MQYDEAVGWLFSTQKFGIKLGLENIRRLLAAIDDPHLAIPCFHVAGTNGKGSVCAMLDRALRDASGPVGLYTSPHLVDFCERIRVDGRPVPAAAVASGLSRLRKISASWDPSPTFFEFATALAFDLFRGAGCRLNVIETGMGGRLDATNVVDPLVSVLTPIGIDHARWLGDSIAAIAAEKAGIVKPGRRTVSAPQRPEAAAVIERVAGERGSNLSFVQQPWAGPLALAGAHQRWNAALAMAALSAAGLTPVPEVFAAAMAQVEWPGRFQILGAKWVLDGAHNPHAAIALAEAWRAAFGSARVPVIFGCLEDKDACGMLRALEPIASAFHIVPVASERGGNPGDLVAAAPPGSTLHRSLHEAIGRLSTAPGRVLITGSLFLIGEALATGCLAQSSTAGVSASAP